MMMIRCVLPKYLNGLESDVLYITTVKPISDRRINQIIDYIGKLKQADLEKVYNRMHFRNLDPNEFNAFFNTIDDFIFKNKIKMIIIDSMTGLADVQFINENNEVDYKSRTIFLKT